MRAVNLLPRDTRSRRGGRRVDPLVAGGAALTVVVVAAVAGGFALAHGHATSEQQKLATARAELRQLQAQERRSSVTTKPVLPTPTVIAQEVPWQAAVTSALLTRVAWDDVLWQLAHVVPANLTLSTVTLGGSATGSTTSATPGAAGSLTVGGTAFSEQGVAQLLARLSLVPGVSGVTLTSSSADPKSGVVTFVVAASVTGASSVAVPSGAAS
ncbi:MAG TPA: PilN domain-containing protein [Gaiellaceae bacterium]|nr:PilN domain-containing protein [Gaiellaceae bacterium]